MRLRIRRKFADDGSVFHNTLFKFLVFSRKGVADSATLHRNGLSAGGKTCFVTGGVGSFSHSAYNHRAGCAESTGNYSGNALSVIADVPCADCGNGGHPVKAVKVALGIKNRRRVFNFKQLLRILGRGAAKHIGTEIFCRFKGGLRRRKLRFANTQCVSLRNSADFSYSAFSGKKKFLRIGKFFQHGVQKRTSGLNRKSKPYPM